jgi:hypothetical protein
MGPPLGLSIAIRKESNQSVPKTPCSCTYSTRTGIIGCYSFELLRYFEAAAGAGLGGGAGSGGLVQTGSTASFDAATAVGFKVDCPQADSNGKRA